MALLDTLLKPKGLQPETDDTLFVAANGSEVRRIKAWLDSRFEVARKEKGMVTETLTITPAQAEYILQTHNTNNRPVSSANVGKFVALIDTGFFRLTSQGLSFSLKKDLLDGQHRLLACVRAGRPITVRVTLGEDEENFAALDSGKARSGSDALAIKGYKYWSNLAAGAKLLAGLEAGGITAKRLTNEEVVAVVEAHPGFAEAAAPAHRITTAFRTASAATVVACYLIKTQSRHAKHFDEFLDLLVKGEGASGPVLRLRDGLMKKTLDKEIRHPEQRVTCVAACIVKAWNGWITGARTQVKWGVREDFPEVE